jgi:hypothetical protein
MRKKVNDPGRTLSAEQRDAVERQLREQGRLQASVDELEKLRGRKTLLQGAEHDTENRGRSGGPREHRPPMTVEVDHTVVVSLRPEARRRDVPVARLVRDLLDRVGAEPGLVGAILDDGRDGVS